tara:strand:+ start:1474 stop:1893 length:420 start_codon:yes stop_codon:yes gene_type:complete
MEFSLFIRSLSREIEPERPNIAFLNVNRFVGLRYIGMKTIPSVNKKVRMKSFFSLNPSETKKGRIIIGIEINLAPMEIAHNIPEEKINIFLGQLLFAFRKQIPAIIGIEINKKLSGLPYAITGKYRIGIIKIDNIAINE